MARGSSLVDELLRRFPLDFEDLKIAVVSVDPFETTVSGALLGDRIRLNSIPHPRAYMRSLATRQANLALSPHVQRAIEVVKAAGFDLVLLETSGIEQSDTEIVDYSAAMSIYGDPEYGATPAREDRHARFRRPGGDQQGGQGRGPMTRPETFASSTSGTASRSLPTTTSFRFI